MSRTWIRRVSLLAVAATSASGVLGVDTISDHLGRDGDTARPQAAGAPLVESAALRVAKVQRSEAYPLQLQHIAIVEHEKSEARLAAQRKALRRASASRAVRSRLVETPTGARSLGRQMAAARGWGASQFSCLDSLWTNESDWEIHAENRSGAYGIPQALPGPRMGDAGADWRTNAVTQIRWGLDYIAARHGTPCGAWAYWRVHRWY